MYLKAYNKEVKKRTSFGLRLSELFIKFEMDDGALLSEIDGKLSARMPCGAFLTEI